MRIIILFLLLPFALASFPDDAFFALLRSYGYDRGYEVSTCPEPRRGSYDFIVVGAGSGGSTVANRLSEKKKWNVLLLEAGKPEGVLNQIPMLSTFTSDDYNWGYKVEPQKNACWGMNDRRCSWGRGKALGGTSSINTLVATRGSKHDYDAWAKMGNDGWSYDDVLPYFKKAEKFNVEDVPDMSYHGTEGNLNIESVPYRTPLANEFVRSAVELGYKHQKDHNGAEQEGFAYVQVTMDQGSRCSAARAYLGNLKRPNLDIVTGAQVTKVLVNARKKAYGVRYMIDGICREVHATKEIVLSAGTIDSAKLLMLSGIGPKDHLRKLGIRVLKDAKVGYNLYEHIGFMGPTFLVNQSVTALSSRLARPSVQLDYAANRSGLLSLAGGVEALSFIRTKRARDARPDLEIIFGSVSLSSDNGRGMKRTLGVSDELYDTVFKPIEGKDAFVLWSFVQDPRSVGRLTLRSKDPLEAPIMQPNLLSDPEDVAVILDGVRIAIEIAKTRGFQAYGTRMHDVKFPQCKNEEFNTDEYWECAIRTLPMMGHHQIGTVKMGPAKDPDAVVDHQLRVHGIRGLRVVDASIMPKMIAGHTNLPTFMIGEKGADMIKYSWMKYRKGVKFSRMDQEDADSASRV